MARFLNAPGVAKAYGGINRVGTLRHRSHWLTININYFFFPNDLL